jgi:hypothetical protein
MNRQKDEKEFRPESEDIGIIGEITGKNREGLEKLAKEEQSQKYRDTTKCLRKLTLLSRKHFKRSEASTQTIEA